MARIAEEIVSMVDMLPDEEQIFAYEFIKRLVRAWDPDFTKLTRKESEELEAAKQSENISAEDIDWDNLDKYF